MDLIKATEKKIKDKSKKIKVEKPEPYA